MGKLFVVMWFWMKASATALKARNSLSCKAGWRRHSRFPVVLINQLECSTCKSPAAHKPTAFLSPPVNFGSVPPRLRMTRLFCRLNAIWSWLAALLFKPKLPTPQTAKSLKRVSYLNPSRCLEPLNFPKSSWHNFKTITNSIAIFQHRGAHLSAFALMVSTSTERPGMAGRCLVARRKKSA